jgi:hypothetical protein
MCCLRLRPELRQGLRELCRVMGLPGKPDALNGADADRYFREVESGRWPIFVKAMLSARLSDTNEHVDSTLAEG